MKFVILILVIIIKCNSLYTLKRTQGRYPGFFFYLDIPLFMSLFTCFSSPNSFFMMFCNWLISLNRESNNLVVRFLTSNLSTKPVL